MGVARTKQLRLERDVERMRLRLAPPTADVEMCTGRSSPADVDAAAASQESLNEAAWPALLMPEMDMSKKPKLGAEPIGSEPWKKRRDCELRQKNANFVVA